MLAHIYILGTPAPNYLIGQAKQCIWTVLLALYVKMPTKSCVVVKVRLIIVITNQMHKNIEPGNQLWLFQTNPTLKGSTNRAVVYLETHRTLFVVLGLQINYVSKIYNIRREKNQKKNVGAWNMVPNICQTHPLHMPIDWFLPSVATAPPQDILTV